MTNPCKVYELTLMPQKWHNYIFLSNDNSDYKPSTAVQRALFVFTKVFEKNVLRKTLGSKRKDIAMMEDTRNVIMGCFMVTSLPQIISLIGTRTL